MKQMFIISFERATNAYCNFSRSILTLRLSELKLQRIFLSELCIELETLQPMAATQLSTAIEH